MHYNNIIPEIDSIFKANTRHHGVFNPNVPKEDQCSSSKAPVTENDWLMHLSGRRGLGLAPILDDDTCRWAAIDVDNHGTEGGVPIEEIAHILALYQFPGIACRSKSGCVHIYVFFGPEITADSANRMLKKWAKHFCLKNYDQSLNDTPTEVFPKQTTLGSVSYPNWINLPYFGITADNPYGDRYAFLDGEKLTVNEFIQWANNNRIGVATIDDLLKNDPPPPCVAAFQYYGIDEGGRNNALYQMGTFASQAHPKQVTPLLRDFNINALRPPLPESEIRKMADRMRRGPKTGYLCDIYKNSKYCNKKICATRKYGQQKLLKRLGEDQNAIAGQDRRKKNMAREYAVFNETIKEKFKFQSLTRYAYENVTFVLKCSLEEKDQWKEYSITLTAADLIRYERVRVLILEQMNYGLPLLKPAVWNEFVNELIVNTKKGHVTDDATPEGVIMRNLIRFFRTGDLSATGDPPRYSDLEQGRPFIYLDDDKKKRVAFAYGDLVEYLEINRRPPIGEKDLTHTFGEAISCYSFDINGTKKQLWTYPFNKHWDTTSLLCGRTT